MGIGKIEPAPPVHRPARFTWQGRSCLRTLLLEASRGGALAGESLWLWGSAHGPRVEMAEAGELCGGAPLDHAFASLGMSPASWGQEDVHAALAGRQGADVDQVLASLARAGVKLASTEPTSPPRFYWPLVHAAVESDMGPTGAAGLRAIGADLFEISQEGMGAIQQLFDLGRKDLLATVAALVEQAELAEPGGSAKLLGIRGPDGSGPMHWAARSLDPKAIALMGAHGVPIHDRDAKGSTPGHWAARKYGAKNQAKAGPALAALSALGFDWASVDKKGVSALAALSAKGPIEPISHILRAAPDAGAAGSVNALGVLAARGADALAVAESVLLDAAAPAPAASKKRPRSSL